MFCRRIVLWVSVSLLAACASDAGLEVRAVPPTVEIVDPVADQLFRQATGEFPIEGRVEDTRDLAEELSVLWTIDAGEDSARNLAGDVDSDGRVTGSFSPDDLTLGNHSLTLTAVDSDGAVGVATVPFRVGGPLGAPEVTILSPEDGTSFAPDESITFQGEAVDSTSPPEELVFLWNSDRDGDLPGALSGDGMTVLVTEDLSTGSHLVTLSVTDGDGEVGVATITVVVAEVVTVAQPGDLVFSEMMVNPQVVPDEVGEWVELYNTSGAPIEVAGYTFRDDDNDAWVLEGSMIVEPYDYFVLCASLDTNPQSASFNGGVPCDAWFNRDYEGEGMALANNPDELVLARPDGVEIDWLHYTNAWWVAGAAIGVDPNHLDGGDNDDPSHWCVQTSIVASGGEPGTPGLPNDPCN